MELVEGETLPSRLPIETKLNYARQIAEGIVSTRTSAA